jgi:hypothetical protein
MWIANKASWQVWRLYDKTKAKEMLAWIIGRYYDRHSEMMSEMFMEIIAEKEKSLMEKKKGKDLSKDDEIDLMEAIAIAKAKIGKLRPEAFIDEKYVDDLEEYGDSLAELVTLRHNFHAMSGHFQPYVKYLTPQCGEFSDHQILLNKFADINRKEVEEQANEDWVDGTYHWLQLVENTGWVIGKYHEEEDEFRFTTGGKCDAESVFEVGEAIIK